MKRKLFLLTMSLFSFLVNLQAQDFENEIASSQAEMNSLEADGAESENVEEASGVKKQKKPRVKKERPPKKQRASKSSEDAAENSEAGENAEALSDETPSVLEQDARKAENEIASSQAEMSSPETDGAESENIEEASSVKKQKKPRVKKERPPKKQRASKSLEDAAENSEAGENAEALPDETPSVLEQDARKAESEIASSQAEMNLPEADEMDSENEKDSEETSKSKKKSRGESEDDPEHWPTIEELTANQYHFGILQNWGLSAASVTRIQKKSDVSNFVWNDKMIGIFYEAKSHDFIRLGEHSELNFIARMAIYYPYSYTFRDVKQIANQIILYAFDWFAAPSFSLSFCDRIIVDTQLGLHIMYQLHDMWEYLNLGVGLKLNIEFPISSRWTVIAGGMFSYENSNFGSNKNMRPFDYVWEYQAQFGVRYSKKYLNRHSYIKYKPKPLKTKRVRKISPLSEEMNLELEVEIEKPEEDVEIEISVENLPAAQYLPTKN